MKAIPLQGVLAMAHARFAAGGRPLRFVIAGGVNTLFGLAVYPALLWSSETLHRKYLLGLVIAQALSLCFAFLTYKLAVFRTRSDALGEFARFLPFYLFNATLLYRLARHGVDVVTVGLFAWVALLPTFKFAWAPLMERYLNIFRSLREPSASIAARKAAKAGLAEPSALRSP